MSDKQRRWWFAQQGRGAKRSGHAPVAYGPNDPVPGPLRAAVSGFLEGARGGASIALNKLTFGGSDALGLTDSGRYQGPEYEFSRGASTVGREALLAATGIKAASLLASAWKGTQTARAIAGTKAGRHLGALSAVAGFGAQSAINDYRAANPAMNPYADKALAMAAQFAGYAGSMGVLKSAHQYGGALLRAIPAGGGISALGRAKQGLKLVDDRLGKAGAWLGGKMPAPVAGALKRAHAGYSRFADFTGSSLKELGAAVKAPRNLAKAKALAKRSADNRLQASVIRTAARFKEHNLKQAATTALNDAHKASLAGSPDAGRLYRKAADAFWAVDDAAMASKKAAGQLTRHAGKLAAKADKLRGDTLAGLRKAAYVAGGLAGVEAYDEAQIRKHQTEAAKAFREGRKFELPDSGERSALGTLGAFAIGTTGNPIEKQTRFGRDNYNAQVGAYRAGYDAVIEARSRGELTADQASKALEQLAYSKPMNMAGKGLWSFAPAAAAFLNWKIGDAISGGKRSAIEKVDHAYDADTVFTRENPQGVRMLDINAPELKDTPTKKAEYLGDVAAARIRELVKPGQYVRVVSDSHQKAAGLDKHGRKLGVVETLPKPFDNLLRIPYLGKVIPAVDMNRKMVREGLADIHYRELSGSTDRAVRMDKARAKAQKDGTGIWSPEGRTALPWVGTEKSSDERYAEWYRKTQGRDLPSAPVGEWSKALGLGLMTTGNSGIFGAMPRSGTALAQSYNALLAALGAAQYNEQAKRASQRSRSAPRQVPTDYDRRVSALLASGSN